VATYVSVLKLEGEIHSCATRWHAYVAKDLLQSPVIEQQLLLATLGLTQTPPVQSIPPHIGAGEEVWNEAMATKAEIKRWRRRLIFMANGLSFLLNEAVFDWLWRHWQSRPVVVGLNKKSNEEENELCQSLLGLRNSLASGRKGEGEKEDRVLVPYSRCL